MLSNATAQVLREAAIVLVVTLAIQGMMYYVGNPLPLASLVVVATVIIGVRTTATVVGARRGSRAES